MIDTATSEVTATITVGSDPEWEAVTPNGKRLYVANGGSDTFGKRPTLTVAATRSDAPRLGWPFPRAASRST